MRGMRWKTEEVDIMGESKCSHFSSAVRSVTVNNQEDRIVVISRPCPCLWNEGMLKPFQALFIVCSTFLSETDAASTEQYLSLLLMKRQ